MDHKQQMGFVTFAKNTDDVNYLELAYLQCLNVKATQTNNRYCVIVDNKTKNIQGMKCGKCGCNLSAKVRSIQDTCPLGKW